MLNGPARRSERDYELGDLLQRQQPLVEQTQRQQSEQGVVRTALDTLRRTQDDIASLLRELASPAFPGLDVGYWQIVAAGKQSAKPKLKALKDEQPSILVVPPRSPWQRPARPKLDPEFSSS